MADRKLSEIWLHGSSLEQCYGRKILLLGAWPDSWEVDFKLHAPYNTVVEGYYAGGKLVSYQVTPPERMHDVTVVGGA